MWVIPVTAALTLLYAKANNILYSTGMWLGIGWGVFFFEGVLHLSSLEPGATRHRQTRDFILLLVVFAVLTYVLIYKEIIVLGV
jgi:hypothetical protein